MEVRIDGELYIPASEAKDHPTFRKESWRNWILRDLNIKVDYLRENHPTEAPVVVWAREPFFKYFWDRNTKEREAWEKEFGEEII